VPCAAGSNRFEDDSSPARQNPTVTAPSPQPPPKARFAMMNTVGLKRSVNFILLPAIMESGSCKNKIALKRGFARFRAFLRDI